MTIALKENMINGILFNKIKLLNDGTAYFEFKLADDFGCSEIKYTGQEKITEEFKEKFQESVNTFISCMPKLQSEINNITMNAIGFDYGKTDKIQKVLYSVKYAFNQANNAVINISTPQIPIFKEEFDEKVFCVSGKDENLLYEIIELAKLYLKGETATKQLKIEVSND